MSKIRIYKLAKELDMESKELINTLQELGMDISSHMSTVDDDTADLVKNLVKEDEESDNSKTEIKDETIKKEDLETESDTKAQIQKEKKEELVIKPPLTVKELSEKIDQEANKIIKILMDSGKMAGLNDSLDTDTLDLLKDKMDLNISYQSEDEKKQEFNKLVTPKSEEKPEDLKLRPPVVTVMGHVDHGKTTLLDVIRKTKVVESESGGITQHIGAYQAEIGDEKITFIDTPGHKAFTAMRARGAQITDIVILVIAADDGVMPQTEEAINHAHAADIPIVVAINKIDKNNAQPQRVKQELTEYGLVPEEWGGDTICVAVSALKEENINELLEMILLVSEMEELKANPDRAAEGFVIEAELDNTRGPVATLLVKNGTLKKGDSLLTGTVYGRVRAMFDGLGKKIEKAPPSKPVEILGFSEVPEAGNYFRVLEKNNRARDIAETRKDEKRTRQIQQNTSVSLEDLYDQIQKGEVKELNLIIKADVHGSIEALKDALINLGTEEVEVNIIHTGVGGINETDVNLASASRAIIIGFNVRPDSNAQVVAEKENIEIKTYQVIYKIIEDVKDAMAGLLDPEIKEVIKGRAEVRDTFNVPEVGTIAGVYIRDGFINRNHQVRLLRDGVVIHDGDISSLKRFEDDVREVNEGYECGIGITDYDDIKVGDILEIYDYIEIKRSL